MVFAHYEEEAAALAADVVNTRGLVSEIEQIEDEAALAAFLRERGMAGDGSPAAADLEEFRRLRRRLEEIFFAPDDATSAERLNAALRESGAEPQVVSRGGQWVLDFTPAEGTGIQKLAASATIGLAALFSESGRTRFGNCSADNCRDVFIDVSRNRSRRYCSESCSSRTNVAAFRARKRSG